MPRVPPVASGLKNNRRVDNPHSAGKKLLQAAQLSRTQTNNKSEPGLREIGGLFAQMIGGLPGAAAHLTTRVAARVTSTVVRAYVDSVKDFGAGVKALANEVKIKVAEWRNPKPEEKKQEEPHSVVNIPIKKKRRHIYDSGSIVIPSQKPHRVRVKSRNNNRPRNTKLSKSESDPAYEILKLSDRDLIESLILQFDEIAINVESNDEIKLNARKIVVLLEGIWMGVPSNAFMGMFNSSHKTHLNQVALQQASEVELVRILGSQYHNNGLAKEIVGRILKADLHEELDDSRAVTLKFPQANNAIVSLEVVSNPISESVEAPDVLQIPYEKVLDGHIRELRKYSGMFNLSENTMTDFFGLIRRDSEYHSTLDNTEFDLRLSLLRAYQYERVENISNSSEVLESEYRSFLEYHRMNGIDRSAINSAVGGTEEFRVRSFERRVEAARVLNRLGRDAKVLALDFIKHQSVLLAHNSEGADNFGKEVFDDVRGGNQNPRFLYFKAEAAATLLSHYKEAFSGAGNVSMSITDLDGKRENNYDMKLETPHSIYLIRVEDGLNSFVEHVEHTKRLGNSIKSLGRRMEAVKNETGVCVIKGLGEIILDLDTQRIGRRFASLIDQLRKAFGRFDKDLQIWDVHGNDRRSELEKRLSQNGLDAIVA